MSMPLFLASSKPAITWPWAGQTKPMSSATVFWLGAELGGTALVGALAAAAVAVRLAAGAAAAATGRTTTPGLSTEAPGGETRSTWPTSITSGLPRVFQRATSRQA